MKIHISILYIISYLYSDEPYIQKFDDCMIRSIKAYYGNDIKWSLKDRKFTYNNNDCTKLF